MQATYIRIHVACLHTYSFMSSLSSLAQGIVRSSSVVGERMGERKALH